MKVTQEKKPASELKSFHSKVDISTEKETGNPKRASIKTVNPATNELVKPYGEITEQAIESSAAVETMLNSIGEKLILRKST